MSFSNKRGQVTIFIIIAIVIVAGIATYVLIKGKASQINQGTISSKNPLSFISSCVEETIREKLPNILTQGGYSEPELYINHDGIKIAYLCYNTLNYYPCINQEPLYLQHIEKEIKESIQEDINTCFDLLKQNNEKEQTTTTIGETNNLNVELADKKIITTFEKEMTLKHNEETKNYKDYKIAINSPAYNLARVVMEMVSQEAEFCTSQYRGFQTLYPWVKIEKTDIRSDTKIYKITDRKTGTEINMAVRSCAIPSGI